MPFGWASGASCRETKVSPRRWRVSGRSKEVSSSLAFIHPPFGRKEVEDLPFLTKLDDEGFNSGAEMFFVRPGPVGATSCGVIRVALAFKPVTKRIHKVAIV